MFRFIEQKQFVCFFFRFVNKCKLFDAEIAALSFIHSIIFNFCLNFNFSAYFVMKKFKFISEPLINKAIWSLNVDNLDHMIKHAQDYTEKKKVVMQIIKSITD